MPIEEVNSNRTREQHSKDSRKAGIASGKARREKKMMRETLETLLKMPLTDKKLSDVEQIKSLAALSGKNITVQDAILLAQVKKAMKGDTRAAEYIRDTSGNKIKDELQLSGNVNNPFEGLTTEQLLKMIGDD